jgi:Ca2+-binding EF-hand superfamily protein
MKSKASPGASGASIGSVGLSPIRLGRKTVLSGASSSPINGGNAPYPAGKSTQERYVVTLPDPHKKTSHCVALCRNAEASRTIVKIWDDRRRESEIHFPTATTSPRAAKSEDSEVYQDHQHRRQDPFFSTGKPPPALEARILAKLQQLKQLGQLAASSPQSVFPGDRFGHISRGQFRQSLVHLNLLVRYADVEALFWTLDTQGRGYITAQDLYDHLNTFATQQSNPSSSKQLPGLSIDATTHRSRLPRSVQKVLEKMLVELPQLMAICERLDTNQTGLVSTTEMLQATHELGIMASIADKHAAIEALSRDTTQRSDHIPYHSLEDRLGALCSDLLSPKKRKKHLSTTSVLLAPCEERGQPVDVRSSYNQDPRVNDALWNCPRRRMHQDHPAARSSIRITDEINPNSECTPVRPPRRSTAVEDAKSRQEQRHRIALVGVLQDLLERRSDLKTALDLHRRADARGQVTKQDLVEILLTSRLNLHFPAGAPAAQELVDELYPTLRPESGLGFLDVLRRISELLGEVTKGLSLAPLPSGNNGPQSTFSTNPYQQPHRPSGRRLNNSLDMHSSVLPTTTGSFTKLAAFPNGESFAGSAATVRRKLLQESRLKDILHTEYGLQSAAVLVRHAFKGLAPRDMVVPIENGEFESTCRASDIKHVCYRLGLDLDLNEQQFVASSVDTGESGFVSSPGLLDFFVKLAQTGDYSTSFSKENEVDDHMRRSVTFSEDGQYCESIGATYPNPITH